MQSYFHLIKSNNWLRDVLLLSFFLIIIYGCWLGAYPLFTPDEGRYSEVAREMIATSDFITPRVNGVAFLDKPVLYYWLQAIAIYIFGLSEWALRFFPAVFGLIGCVSTYSFGRYIFNRQTGWFSAIILATSLLYFAGAHYANLDLEIAIFINLTLYSFIAAVHINTPFLLRKKLLFAAYIFSALGFLTKGLIGIALPGLIGLVWMTITKRLSLLKRIYLLPGILIFFIIISPWYILVQRANPSFFHYFFITQQVTRFLSAAEFNSQAPIWFYLPIILIGTFPWSIFLPGALYHHIKTIIQKKSESDYLLVLLLWFSLILIFFSIPTSKIISYIFPMLPPAALIVGHYISVKCQKNESFRAYTIIFSLSSILFSGLLFSLYHLSIFDLPSPFQPYLIFICLIFLIASIIAIFFLRLKRGIYFISLLALTSTMMLLVLIIGASALNQTTSKPLALYLKKIIKPRDEVVAYFKYYQDIPIYLEKRISIVADWQSSQIPYRDNWIREMWYGMPFQKTDDWLIGENTFWERWQSKKRLFVFVNKNYLDQFVAAKKPYFLMKQYNDVLLLSNKPA